jgi:hypothetical protein
MEPNIEEVIMRIIAVICALFVYLVTKTLGISVLQLLFQSLIQSSPFYVAVFGFIVPSALGITVSWYVIRQFRALDPVKDAVGARVLVLVISLVFFLYCDSYISSYNSERTKELENLLPNISFSLSVLLYAILKFRPGDLTRG